MSIVNKNRIRNKRKTNNISKLGRLIKISAGIAALDAAAGCGLYNYALSRRPLIKWKAAENIPFKSTWIADNCKDVYITSSDGIMLHGYFAACPEKVSKYVVMCHGYRADATSLGEFAEQFYSRGYGILAPDARGHGKSDGKYVGMGWPERRDIIEWINLVLTNEPEAEIVLYGISMGGATVMCASGESDLPANVKAVIEDCGYSSMRDEFEHEIKLFKVPKPLDRLLMSSMRLATRIFAGYDIAEGGAVTQLPKSKTPTLFIHGDADNFVPYRMMYDNFNACAAEKLAVPMSGTTHARSIFDHPQEYWKAIDDFLIKTSTQR